MLDRSCSMTQRVDAGLPSKWVVAGQALQTLTQTFQGRIRFGMGMFPDLDADKCNQDGGVFVPVSDDGGTEIQILMNAAEDAGNPLYPKGPCVTPIDTGMVQASREPEMHDPSRAEYALLMTDGAQAGCSAAGGTQGAADIITAMRVDAGIRTFVIGFGGSVSVSSLNLFADAGGEANLDGGTLFYNAGDPATLNQVFTQIATQTLSCTYSLSAAPPDPSLLYVFFNGSEQIARDTSHVNGWDYNPANNQVDFYGTQCTRITGGSVSKVQVVYGCPSPIN